GGARCGGGERGGGREWGARGGPGGRYSGAGGVSDRLVRLLGLGARGGGGRVVVGVTSVRAQLQRDALSCVVLASDASVRTREKVERLARARRVPVLVGPVAERLGAGLGRPPVQAVGVADAALARGLVGSLEEGVTTTRIHDLAAEVGISAEQLMGMLKDQDL